MRKASRAWIVVAALSALLCAVTAGAVQQGVRAGQLADAADAASRRALYESAELLGAVQANLLKLPACASVAQKQGLLADISRQAFGVQENLAALPASARTLEGAIKFANQIEDYADALLVSLATGGGIGKDDMTQLSALSRSCGELQARLLGGAESLEPVSFAAPAGGNETQDPSVQYPTLIYDGPFSDGAQSPILPGGEPVSAGEAVRIARDYIGQQRAQNVVCTGEVALPAPCWELEADCVDGKESLCVLQSGGRVLYMLGEGGSAEERLPAQQCVDLAAAFLEERGYGPMQPTFSSRENGFLTVNFAAVDGEILLYPDLVKVEVNMETGLVTGVEARAYLASHRDRDLPQPSLSREDAAARVSEALTVDGTRLCVIPTSPGERLAWEVTAIGPDGGVFLVYIDAENGAELEILRLVETAAGIETE